MPVNLAEDYIMHGTRYIRWNCVSSSGQVSTTSTGSMALDVYGTLSNVKWTPDDSGGVIFTGNNVPAAGWDCDILCSQYSSGGNQVFGFNHDVAYGLGTNLSTAGPTQGMPVDGVNGGPIYLNGHRLKPYSTNAGDAKKFTIELMIGL